MRVEDKRQWEFIYRSLPRAKCQGPVAGNGKNICIYFNKELQQLQNLKKENQKFKA
jgi:hypothetical protein